MSHNHSFLFYEVPSSDDHFDCSQLVDLVLVDHVVGSFFHYIDISLVS